MILQSIDGKFRDSEIELKNEIGLLERAIVTKREQEVLQRMSEGLTVKEIADDLFISPHTIISHKKKLVEKFEARNSVDLIVKTIRLGYINIY